MNSNHRVCHMVKTDDEEFEFFLKQCQKRRGQVRSYEQVTEMQIWNLSEAAVKIKCIKSDLFEVVFYPSTCR